MLPRIDPRHDGENLFASCDSQADFVIKLVSGPYRNRREKMQLISTDLAQKHFIDDKGSPSEWWGFRENSWASGDSADKDPSAEDIC